MAGHSGWTITGQVSDQAVNTPAGQAITGTYVYFLTGNGNRGSVFVADDHYNARTVREAVNAKAAMVDEVAALAEGIAHGG